MENGKKQLNIGIIGLGLIGGSYAKAAKLKTRHRVFGYNRNPSIAAAALKDGVLDGVLDGGAFRALDILIFGVSPKVLDAVLFDFLPKLKPGCIVTDSGGLKTETEKLFKTAKEKYPHLEFIGAHPMAGKEVSGYENSDARLFENASAIFVPLDGTADGFVETLKSFYEELGFGSIVFSTAAEHDRIIAYTSQGCHAVSVSYALNPLYKKRRGFSAGSLKDLTRVAKTDAGLWSELFCDNSDNLVPVLDGVIDNLTRLKTAVAQKSTAVVKKILDEANEMKKE